MFIIKYMYTIKCMYYDNNLKHAKRVLDYCRTMLPRVSGKYNHV